MGRTALLRAADSDEIKSPLILCQYAFLTIAERAEARNIDAEASASLLMTPVVSTALLKEVRASASVGDGGRRR